MNILFAASEAFPFCKTGGLADVIGSLPAALTKRGEAVSVILPLYGQISQHWRDQMTFERYIYVDLSWRHEYCGLFSLRYGDVQWYFVDNEHYFHRTNLYGEYDDGERFAFFSKAVVALLPFLHDMPQVIHCNDWHTALVSVYLKDLAVRNDALRSVSTVFTIHNMEYQGRFAPDTVSDLLGLHQGWWDDGTLQMDGDVNLMKAGLLMSDAITTVSPTYAQQIRSPRYAYGLHSVVARCADKLHGVLNGLNIESYDPAADMVLPAAFAPDHMEGKRSCKEALQRQLGLKVDADAPLIAMVTRLAEHKGLDLVCRVFDGIIESGAQFVLLGTGEPQYADFFRRQAECYSGRVAVRIEYSESLSRQIYAGSDLFLMPSRSEPCGLSQLIAMRYGAVPIVRQTGGLNDTVHDCQVGQSDGNGFVFSAYNAHDMLFVLRHAVDLYRYDRTSFQAVQRHGMCEDFSWERSAETYRNIYRNIMK